MPDLFKLIEPLFDVTPGDRIEVHTPEPGPRGTTRVFAMLVEDGDTPERMLTLTQSMCHLHLGDHPAKVRYLRNTTNHLGHVVPVAFDLATWSV